MKGYEALREAVAVIPVPGAPPRTSTAGAAVGLSFLDTVLRLNHVRRITDRLRVVEHGSAHRTTEVDIDLGMLDENQRRAARLYHQVVGQGQPVGRDGTSVTMWVPVARISRRSVAPVDVLDGMGQKLPKLTQYETSRLLASALFHLLRGILGSAQEARREGSRLNDLLSRNHEARWLIQSALQTLLIDRSRPAGRPRQVGNDHDRNRALALEVLEQHEPLLADYQSLLDIAVEDYLLVVGLDGGSEEHLLTYETPMPVKGSRRRSLPPFTNLKANSRGYFAAYHNTIPASLRSFHLVVDTEHGVDIERMYLSTDADRQLVDELTTDLGTLADRLSALRGSAADRPSNRVLELAVDTALRKVAGLLRRKQWDADQAEVLLAREPLTEVAALAEAAVNDEIVHAWDDRQDRTVADHPVVTPAALRTAAAQLNRLGIGSDLALENDPVSYRAHAYWRRDTGWLPSGASQIEVHAGMILRDSTAVGPISVFLYTAGMTAVSYVMAVLLAGHPFPYFGASTEDFDRIGNQEAVIAVLLLVPGFLYSRLSLPDKHSIAGYLRALPRRVAQLCIAMMAAVAAAVAAGSPGKLVAMLFFLSVVVPFVAACAALAPSILGRRKAAGVRANGDDTAKRKSGRELWLLGAPSWVHRVRPEKTRRWKPDVVFGSRMDQNHD